MGSDGQYLGCFQADIAKGIALTAERSHAHQKEANFSGFCKFLLLRKPFIRESNL